MSRLGLLFFSASCLAASLAQADTLPGKYDEWEFVSPQACIRTKDGKIGANATNAKLCVVCENSALYIELTPTQETFGSFKKRDNDMREKFDDGDRKGRVWLFDAGKARLDDYSQVKDFVRQLQDGERQVVMSGDDAASNDFRFRFSLLKSTSKIRELKDDCPSR